MKKQTNWINDLLKIAEANPAKEIIEVIEGCGYGCAEQNGHIAGVAPLKEAALSCKTHDEIIAFMRSTFPFEVEDGGDSVIIHFHKEHCTCPMAPEVKNPMLCYCTLGHEKAMWGELFGREIDAEIVESFQRGGKDCVIKLYI